MGHLGAAFAGPPMTTTGHVDRADSDEDDGPPVASPSTVAPSLTGGSLPAASTISYTGFGSALWDASEEQVRQAWGKGMDDAPSESNGCDYLLPKSPTEGGFRIGFLMTEMKLRRVDVVVPDFVAPGGGRVGMDKAELRALYPTMTEEPHKYTDGALYLRVGDPQGGKGALVFETDKTGKIAEWRIGVPPEVDYVERCG